MKFQVILISCFALLSTALARSRYTNPNRSRHQKPAQKEEAIPEKIESVDDGLKFLNQMWEKHGEKHGEEAKAGITSLYGELEKIAKDTKKTEDEKYLKSKNKLIKYAKKNFKMNQEEADTFFDEREEQIRGFMATVDIEKTQELLNKVKDVNIKDKASELTDLIENEDAKKAANDFLKVINKNVDLDKSVDDAVQEVGTQLWSFLGTQFSTFAADFNKEESEA